MGECEEQTNKQTGDAVAPAAHQQTREDDAAAEEFLRNRHHDHRKAAPEEERRRGMRRNTGPHAAGEAFTYKDEGDDAECCQRPPARA